VAIGNVITSTDLKGMFQFTGITPPYDVAFRLTTPLTYGWFFVGLTTATPVLQVTTEMGPTRSINYLTLTLANAPPTFPPPNEYLGYSWGSLDGRFSTYVRGATDIESPTWYGPTTAVGAAHVLAWMMDAASLPTTYVGYDTTPVTLVDGVSSGLALDLTKTHPGTGALSGSVTLRSLATPHNDVYVALPNGAYIKIVNEDRTVAQRDFNYKVPMGITGSSMLVCAQAGSSIEFPFSYAYKHGLTPGQTGVALAVPDPATPGAPGNGAVVSSSTDFSWTAPAGQQGPALYTVGLELGDRSLFSHVRIVTSKMTARMPKFPAALGAIVPPSVSGVWWVETSDSYGSIDAAATGNGFIDTFDYDATAMGLLDRDGTHSWSATHTLTTSASP
jgi:hypothetical protein